MLGYYNNAVASAVAVGLAHKHGIEAVTAFVVRKPGADAAQADEASLLDFCKRRLGRHEVPKRIVFVERTAVQHAGASGNLQICYRRLGILASRTIQASVPPLMKNCRTA